MTDGQDTTTRPERKDIVVVVTPAVGRRCRRCRKVLEEVGTDDRYSDLCLRCADVVAQYDADYPERVPFGPWSIPFQPWETDGEYIRCGVPRGDEHYELRRDPPCDASRNYWKYMEAEK